jgi:molecular chaperone GrpE
MSKKNETVANSTEFKQDSCELKAKITELEEHIATLTSKTEELEGEKEQFKDISLRAKAELDNTIKRTRNDIDKARTYGGQKLLEDIIPVIDSLELGIANSQTIDTEKSHADGMSLTLDLLMKTINKHGVEQINPVDETFDPQFHEAMTLQPSKDHKPHSIINVLQKGYVLKDRLIRPARVIVAKEIT